MLDLNCKLLIICPDLSTKSNLVLSLDKESIVFPSIMLDITAIRNINTIITSALKQLIPNIHPLDIFPKLHTLHSVEIEKEMNTDNVVYPVYSILVGQKYKTSSICDWIPFDIINATKYNYTLATVLQEIN